MTLLGIKQEFSKYIALPDYSCLDVALACSVANRLKGPSLNIYIVGPSSTAKSEVLYAMAGHPSNHYITDLTPRTFFSGALGDNSMIPQRYRDGVRSILVQDFTLVLQKRHEERQQIISQIRGIADGYYHSEFGQSSMGRRNLTIDWHGTMGFLCAVTSAIEDAHAVSNVMGERFLNYRMPDLDDDKSTEIAQEALFNTGDEWRLPMQQSVSEFLDKFERADEIDVNLPRDMAKCIRGMAIFIAHARMAVPRDRYHKHLVRLPEREGATRLVKQLSKLTQGLLLVQEKATADHDLYQILIDIVWSNMPRVRSRILKYLWWSGPKSVEEVAEKLRMPGSSTRVFLENLMLCELVSHKDEKWEMSETCKQMVKDTGILM